MGILQNNVIIEIITQYCNIMAYQSLEEEYNDIHNPIENRKRFKTKASYYNWCFEQSNEELNIHLRVFLQEEHYEDCAIIRDVLKLKKN